MALFGGNSGFDRSRLLDAAARARAKRRRRRAIALYRWVLAVEPRNAELHAKLAPLLAETGQAFDAWVSFRAIAQAFLRQGHAEKALAVYREAARFVPREIQVWQSMARLQRKGGRDGDALETLLEGSRRFRPRWLRPQAIYLLRRAREIDPWNFEVVLELARQLATSDQRQEAHLLLDGLAERCQGHRLRRVRGAQLRLAPGLGNAWRWLRAALRREEEAPVRGAGTSSSVVPLRSRSGRRG